jgi:group I intron endonuclease
MAKKSLDASLVGIQYHKPPFNVYLSISNHPISLRRDPTNQHDKNAVEVIILGHKIGYLNKESAISISKLIDSGFTYKIEVKKFTSGSKSIALSIQFEIPNNLSVTKPNLVNVAGIYEISINNKEFVYIGQSININERVSSHWTDLEFNAHVNKNLQHLWNTKGSSSFSATILEIAPSNFDNDLMRQRWLADREKNWIKISREKYNCVNITDGEIIATKNALKEYREEKKSEDKKYDAEIKEKKKLINLQLEKAEQELAFHKKRLAEYKLNVAELDSFIRKNTGIRGYFSGTATKVEIIQKKSRLDKALTTLRDQESLVTKLYNHCSDLKIQRKGLKTTKQIEALTGNILIRHGINPYSTKKKIQ